jgi:steroid 5-alpha reductase family enzyme
MDVVIVPEIPSHRNYFGVSDVMVWVVSLASLSKSTIFNQNIMPGRTRDRTQVIERRSMKPRVLIFAVFSLSLYFATAIDGFSPSTPLRFQERKRIQNNGKTSRQFGLLPRKSRDLALRIPTTNLRGGFMSPPTGNPILRSIGIYALTDFVGFLASIFTGSHLHLDLVGTGAFAVAALPYLRSGVAHIRWSSAAIFLWGTKLSLFLFYRATKVKHDNRLTDVLASTQGAFQFWFITFVWNVMVSIPYLIGLSSERSNTLALISGGVLYLVGLTIESLADAQKYFFKQQQSSPGQFCNIGLWKYSQHPNWFGNLVLWTGILVMNLPALVDPLPAVGGTDNKVNSGLLWRLWSVRKLIMACFGPGFLWLLFNGQATGNITNAVELANAKYAKNPEYAKYIKDVPLIIPKSIFKH